MSTRSKTLQPKSWAIKAPEYVLEAKKFNVFINTPSVNKSGYEFTIFDNENKENNQKDVSSVSQEKLNLF